MSSSHPHGGPADVAALYVVGALPPEDAAAFESHLCGCETCRAEVTDLSVVAASLAAGVPEVAPPASLRARLLERLKSTTGISAGTGSVGGVASDSNPAAAETGATQPWKLWEPRAGAEDAGLHIVRRDEGNWEETGVAGVRVRRLFIDAERNQFTALVRMDAGTSYPRHVHNGAEECLVLEGELHVGDTVLRAGDYQRALAGSQHGVQSTDQGCLLMIVSSLTDEIY